MKKEEYNKGSYSDLNSIRFKKGFVEFSIFEGFVVYPPTKKIAENTYNYISVPERHFVGTLLLSKLYAYYLLWGDE